MLVAEVAFRIAMEIQPTCLVPRILVNLGGLLADVSFHQLTL
jgi:hypothetical protein